MTGDRIWPLAALPGAWSHDDLDDIAKALTTAVHGMKLKTLSAFVGGFFIFVSL